MLESSEKKLLRFGCPACGIRLVVDSDIAGTEGPCPSCGALIIAPPLNVAGTLVEKAASPLAVQPRNISKRQLDGSKSVQNVPDRVDSSAPPQKAQRRARAVNPATVISQEHEEKKNTKAFLMMIMITSLVMCIALGVYYYMVYGQ